MIDKLDGEPDGGGAWPFTNGAEMPKSYTMAKNATMKDYRKATGFEALMGYLYLKGETERLVSLS